MSQNQVVVITPQELQRLIYDAVNVAVQQIRLPQKDDPLPEYMSIDQASQFLNLAVPTLYGLTSKRQVPFIKKSKITQGMNITNPKTPTIKTIPAISTSS